MQLGLPQSHNQLKSEVFWFVLLHVISWIVLVFLDKRNFAQKVGRNVEFGFAARCEAVALPRRKGDS